MRKTKPLIKNIYIFLICDNFSFINLLMVLAHISINITISIVAIGWYFMTVKVVNQFKFQPKLLEIYFVIDTRKY